MPMFGGRNRQDEESPGLRVVSEESFVKLRVQSPAVTCYPAYTFDSPW